MWNFCKKGENFMKKVFGFIFILSLVLVFIVCGGFLDKVLFSKDDN